MVLIHWHLDVRIWEQAVIPLLAQIAADCLNTPMDNIVVFSVDTDISPYDSGSYASATTYTTGVAVMKACEELKKKICSLAQR